MARELENKEKLLLTPDLKKRLKLLETSILIAFYDVLFEKQDTFEWIIKNKYAFHYESGWILEFNPNLYKVLAIFRARCKQIYYRSLVGILVERSKAETTQKKLPKWARKSGYRFVLCVRKKDGKSNLLSIARHISVPIKNATRKQTKYALSRARIIAKSKNLSYPNIYKIDRTILYYLMQNEMKAFKLMKKLVNNKKFKFIA